MDLTYNKGEFSLLNSLYDFKDILRNVPTAKWDSSRKVWTYKDTADAKEVLLLLCQNGLISADKAARGVLLEYNLQANLRNDVRGIKEASRIDIDVPLKVELFQHQKKAYKIGITLPRTGLLMEQGTGKTLTSLAIAGHRYLKGEIRKVLVVAPLSTLTPWKKEILNFVDYPVEVKNLCDKKGDKRGLMLKEFTNSKSLKIALINHQSVWRIYDEIEGWAPDMIIVDESQRIKNGQAKQSKALHKLGDQVKYKLILTGTPVTQGPLDVWSQYRFLDPDIFGRTFGKFKDRYAVMGGFKNYKVVGFQHLDELIQKAHSISYRVKKADTEIDLPPITNQYLYATLGKEGQRYYNEMKKDFKITLAEHGANIKAPIVLTKLLRLQQITGGFLKIEKEDSEEIVQVDSGKLDLLKELIEDFPEDKKVVIFARFIPEVHAIAEELRAMGRVVLTLTGGKGDRGAIIEQFQKDPKTTVMVAQIQTGGVGINLQVADTAIFYSPNFSYGDYDQAKARVHRIGQKSQNVTYIHLVVENTVDERILEALEAKKDVATHVVDTFI